MSAAVKRIEAMLAQGDRRLSQISARLADLHASQRTGHILHCQCLACDGWRYRIRRGYG
jgi:hypothetical protein